MSGSLRKRGGVFTMTSDYNKPPAGFSLGDFDLCTYKKQKESDIGAYTIKQTTDYYKTILRA